MEKCEGTSRGKSEELASLEGEISGHLDLSIAKSWVEARTTIFIKAKRFTFNSSL